MSTMTVRDKVGSNARRAFGGWTLSDTFIPSSALAA
jgi:hypothetical protein